MARGLDSGGQGEASVLAAVADGEGNCALHLAAAAGRVDVCRYIVEDLRLDVNQPNFKGETPLFASAYCGGAAAARYLIDHGADPLAGADVNFVDSSGLTSLMLTVQSGLPDTLTCLLDAGANPNIPDEFGVTPIEFAASKGRRDMVEMLFPLTSPIPTLLEWSIDGIISHVKSFGLKPRAMEFDPSPDDFATMLANRSLRSLRAGNGRTALSDATMCRSARPHWPKACYWQGAAFMLLKDYEKACEAFADGLKLDPKSAEIANALREAREAAKNAR
ncbi:hypothetical protein ACQ4PT_037121 [Festuca glaucescens]